MMQKLIVTTVVALLSLSAMAQGDHDVSALASAENVNVERNDITIELDFSDFEKNLDDLMQLWRVQQTTLSSTLIEDLSSTVITDLPDSVYIERLQRLPSLVTLTYNSAVRSSIHVYTSRTGSRREQMEVMIGMSKYYFPIFDEIMDQYDMPHELRYLAIIESALNPRAVSRARATGIWQFMLATGRMYGLQVTTFVDQRRDPVAATHAAARYLRDLHNMYGDWTLAMAAYNCGPGNVNRAIRRAGGKTCYWEIYPHLPRETRGYMPIYIGAMYAMNYYKEHGFTPRFVNLPPPSDTIMVNRNINLAQVAEVMDIPLQLLRDLNPQYLRDIIPGSSAPHPLRLPVLYTAAYIDMENTIANHRADVLLSNSFRPVTPASSSSSSSSTAASASTNTAGRERVVHTIRSGETLGTIASRYGVTVRNLQAWNNMGSSTRIVAGRQLVIYRAPRTQASTTSSTSAALASASTSSTSGSGNVIYHTVRSGDTVWGIARMYEGVSDNDILRWNNLQRNSRITPGMRLRIER